MTVTAAMALANRGLAVFPVDPMTKAPKTRHGYKDATRSEASIIQLWRKWPSAGIGVATGEPSGIVVLDIDPRNGGEDGFSDLAGRLGAPGATVRVITPSGGWHAWYRAPSVPVTCSAGKLAPGVDVRGDGGYVVAPPTTRPDGTGWRWAGGSPLAELQPEWLDALTAQNAAAPARPVAGPGSYVAMLAAGIPSGQRNQALTSLIGHLLAHDVDVHLAAHILHLLNRSACHPPLDGVEVEKIVASIAGREARKRRGIA